MFIAPPQKSSRIVTVKKVAAIPKKEEKNTKSNEIANIYWTTIYKIDLTHPTLKLKYIEKDADT